jgi:antitoxin YefM
MTHLGLLYVLQNASLVQQIAQSTETHHQNQGYSPTKKEVNEILGF